MPTALEAPFGPREAWHEVYELPGRQIMRDGVWSV